MLSGISLIDVIIHIFDVDYVIVYNRNQFFYILLRNIERGFDSDSPFWATELAELPDKFAL